MQKLLSVEVDATSNGTLLVPLINENIPNHLHFYWFGNVKAKFGTLMTS